MVSAHVSQDAPAAVMCRPQSVTARAFTAHRGSGNPLMHARRERVAAVLRRLFGDQKQIAMAACFGVSRTLALRWLDQGAVDRNPAPLALLLAVDDESFEVMVSALRDERAAMRRDR